MSISKIKLLTILAAMMFFISLFINFNSVSVFASTGTDPSGITWQSNDGSTCYITGYTGSATNIAIPNSISGYSVTGIGNYAFFQNRTITSVVIPNSVTSIGEHAFDNCSSLTNINIPNGVTSIGAGTFNQCKSLTSITIPGTVTSIGDYAFFECIKITSVTIPNGVTFLGESAFGSCKELQSVYMPDSVTSVGKYTFNDCFKLNSVRLSNNLTSIVDQMFCRNWALTSISLPSGITRIGIKAFEECGLTSITIPNSVTTIGGRAFLMCKNLSNVTIPNSVKTIDFNAFAHCYSFTNIVIPSSVTSIEREAFYSCKNLIEITIPKSVTNIGFLTFDNCNSNFKIKGYSGSTAQVYAGSNKIAFEVIPTTSGSNNNNTSQTPPAQNQGSSSPAQNQGSNSPTPTQESNKSIVTQGSDQSVKNQVSNSKSSKQLVSKNEDSKETDTGVLVSPNTVNLKVGNKQTLVVTFLPNDASKNHVTWTSSNENVAIVDQTGVVTAKGIGVATITATVGTKTSSCVVIVANKSISLSGNAKRISITADESVLNSAVNLSVSEVDNKYNGLNLKYSKKYSVINCFDFKLEDANGKEVEPTDNVVVTIPLSPSLLKSADKYLVIYIDDNGTAHEIKPTIDGSNLNFTTDHFSRYAIATIKTENPKQDSSLKIPLFSMMFILSAMIGVAFYFRKRRVFLKK